MAYPEPRNLDDIYGVGAERAEAFAEALDKQVERATKAGVSYTTILAVVTALANAGEEDNSRNLEVRKEMCGYCGTYVSNWVDPDWSSGRICRECETLHEPTEIAKAKSLYRADPKIPDSSQNSD